MKQHLISPFIAAFPGSLALQASASAPTASDSGIAGAEQFAVQ